MEELLTVKEIAAHTKTSMSFWYKRNELEDGDPRKPPTLRVGEELRYKASEIERWMAETPSSLARKPRKDKGQPKHTCDATCTFGTCDCTCHKSQWVDPKGKFIERP